MTYYESCLFHKPKDKKKHKKVNGYKDKAKRICCYSGEPFAERHEIFRGNNRQISIDNGFQIDVRKDIHEELQANTTKWAQRENLRWKRHFQKLYEGTLIASGMTPEQAREVWTDPRFIGRNYLDD